MIKRLRRQFILIATAAVLIILTALIGVTTASIFGVVNLFIDRTLERFQGDEQNDNFMTRQLLGPLSSYDVFYYEIEIDDDYQVISYDDSHHTDTLTKTTAQNLADKAESSHNNRFTYQDDYYAWIIIEKNNIKRLYIIDYTMVMNWVFQIRHLSFIIGLAGLIVFELLIIILSDRAIRPALENEENQKRFITNASHELKTPVAVISADNDVIEAMHGSDEWTQSIRSQVKRLNQLITAMVELSKGSERGKIELHDVDLSAIASESINNYRPLFDQHNLKITFLIEPNIHASADEKIVSEIAGILLDNAAKYCDEGGEINVKVSKTSSHVYFSVSNTYKEGKDVDYKRFFERFYRADTSHNSEKKGFGIGLSLAQELADSIKANLKADWKNDVISFMLIF